MPREGRGGILFQTENGKISGNCKKKTASAHRGQKVNSELYEERRAAAWDRQYRPNFGGGQSMRPATTGGSSGREKNQATFPTPKGRRNLSDVLGSHLWGRKLEGERKGPGGGEHQEREGGPRFEAEILV